MSDLSAPFRRPIKGITIDGQQSKEVARWIKWADADYLAARLLFMIDLIIQATALSNTAIEKYLKAVCCFYNIKIPKGYKGHDVAEIYAAIKATAASNKLDLNVNYLKLLKTAYAARYPDDLPDGFCIALSTVKMLTQLDRSVVEITARFRRVSEEDDPLPMTLDEAVQKKDRRYVDLNVGLNPALASSLYSQPSWCFEMRKHDNSFFESIYRVPSLSDDGLFPSCAPVTAEEKWETAFKPVLFEQTPASS